MHSGSASFAVRSATRMSQAIASSKPPPYAPPLIAQITGTGSAAMRSKMRLPHPLIFAPDSASQDRNWLTSAPAQKIFGLVLPITTARSWGMCSSVSSSHSRSCSSPSPIQLTGGASSRICATCSSVAKRRHE